MYWKNQECHAIAKGDIENSVFLPQHLPFSVSLHHKMRYGKSQNLKCCFLINDKFTDFENNVLGFLRTFRPVWVCWSSNSSR